MVETGTVEMFDPLKTPATMFTLRDVHLNFKPSPDCETTGRRLLDLQGFLAAEQVQRVDLAGTVDLDAQRWELHGNVEGMEFSPELRAATASSGGRRAGRARHAALRD